MCQSLCGLSYAVSRGSSRDTKKRRIDEKKERERGVSRAGKAVIVDRARKLQKTSREMTSSTPSTKMRRVVSGFASNLNLTYAPSYSYISRQKALDIKGCSTTAKESSL